MVAVSALPRVSAALVVVNPKVPVMEEPFWNTTLVKVSVGFVRLKKLPRVSVLNETEPLVMVNPVFWMTSEASVPVALLNEGKVRLAPVSVAIVVCPGVMETLAMEMPSDPPTVKLKLVMPMVSAPVESPVLKS